MIGYTTLGTNDLEAATRFYDELFGLLQAKRIPINERITLWSTGRDKPMLGVAVPYDGAPASPGNGTMVAINVGDASKVDEVHAKALALGGSDEGAPGKRGDNFYGGYFRDPDGNKLVAFCIQS